MATAVARALRLCKEGFLSIIELFLPSSKYSILTGDTRSGTNKAKFHTGSRQRSKSEDEIMQDFEVEKKYIDGDFNTDENFEYQESKVFDDNEDPISDSSFTILRSKIIEINRLYDITILNMGMGSSWESKSSNVTVRNNHRKYIKFWKTHPNVATVPTSKRLFDELVACYGGQGKYCQNFLKLLNISLFNFTCHILNRRLS